MKLKKIRGLNRIRKTIKSSNSFYSPLINTLHLLFLYTRSSQCVCCISFFVPYILRSVCSDAGQRIMPYTAALSLLSTPGVATTKKSDSQNILYIARLSLLTLCCCSRVYMYSLCMYTQQRVLRHTAELLIYTVYSIYILLRCIYSLCEFTHTAV